MFHHETQDSKLPSAVFAFERRNRDTHHGEGSSDTKGQAQKRQTAEVWNSQNSQDLELESPQAAERLPRTYPARRKMPIPRLTRPLLTNQAVAIPTKPNQLRKM